MDHEHPDQLTGHDNPWRQAEHAEAWIARTDGAARDRTRELETFGALVPLDAETPARALELGAGAGGLTRVLLEQFPRLEVLALDLSPVMIDEGRQRLAAFGDRVRFVQWDLEDEGWPVEAAGPFDLVVSSIAIHHLERARKAALARQIFGCLRPGGAFLNVDYVAPPTERLTERYARAQQRLGGGEEQGGHSFLAGGHASGTLFEYLEDLHAAGFVDVDVFWKQFGLAITGGTRPAG